MNKSHLISTLCLCVNTLRPMGVVCLYICTFFLSTSAYATIISYEFSGIITKVTDNDGLLTGTSIVPITSTFTGKFSYDDSVSPVSTSSTNQLYPVITFSAIIDNNFNYVGIKNDPNAPTPNVNIGNNAGSFGDIFSVAARDPNTEFDINPGGFNSLQLFMTDSSATAFSSTMLPSEVNLNDFNGRIIFFSGGEYGSSSGSLNTQYVIEGTLSSLTKFPIQPALEPWIGNGAALKVGDRDDSDDDDREMTLKWTQMVGIREAGNLVGTGVGQVTGAGQPWSAKGGKVQLNLLTGRLDFEVRGLVLAGGNNIGTPGRIAQIQGTLVCDTDGSITGDSVLVDTPSFELSAQGNARFSGNVGPLPDECFYESDIVFLIRTATPG